MRKAMAKEKILWYAESVIKQPIASIEALTPAAVPFAALAFAGLVVIGSNH
jgi:hypothetical protein